MEEFWQFLRSVPSWCRVLLLVACIWVAHSWAQQLIKSVSCEWVEAGAVELPPASPPWKASVMMSTLPKIYLHRRKGNDE